DQPSDRLSSRASVSSPQRLDLLALLVGHPHPELAVVLLRPSDAPPPVLRGYGRRIHQTNQPFRPRKFAHALSGAVGCGGTRFAGPAPLVLVKTFAEGIRRHHDDHRRTRAHGARSCPENRCRPPGADGAGSVRTPTRPGAAAPTRCCPHRPTRPATRRAHGARTAEPPSRPWPRPASPP